MRIPVGQEGEGFSSRRSVAGSVRVVYCRACGAVSTNVLGERDICTRCGSPAERMTWRRPWQSYASGVILLAAAVAFIWGPFTDPVVRAVLFFAALAVCVFLGNWGLNQTRDRVLAEVASREARGGKT